MPTETIKIMWDEHEGVGLLRMDERDIELALFRYYGLKSIYVEKITVERENVTIIQKQT